MNILFTAEYDKKWDEEIHQLGQVQMMGWAIGNPKIPESKLCDIVSDTEVIVTSYDAITSKVIDAAKNLKLIACTRGTPVNIDTAYAKGRDIPVIHTPGRNADSAAEMTIALMLNCARNIPQAHLALHHGLYCSEEKKTGSKNPKEDITWGVGKDQPYAVFKGVELKDRSVGIIGFGSIGRRVSVIARAFGMNVLVYDPFISEIDVDTLGQTKVDLDNLLYNSDFVSCHVKITPETKGMIDKNCFSKMKSDAFFINTSRAAAVDEEALLAALKNKEIKGAGLDVFSREPIPCDHPFLTEFSDRVVATPHIAGATEDAIANHTQMLVSDMKRFLAGKPMLYLYER